MEGRQQYKRRMKNTIDFVFETHMAWLPCGCLHSLADNEMPARSRSALQEVVFDLKCLAGADVSEQELVDVSVSSVYSHHACPNKPADPFEGLPSCRSCGVRSGYGILCENCR